MKEIIIKVDRGILNIMTQYVRRWIAWQDYKKHSIDFMIDWEWCELGGMVIWGICIPAALYVVEGNELGAVVQIIAWSIVVAMQLYWIHYTKTEIKPFHDVLFSLRDNAAYNAAHAEILKTMFIKSRRSRLRTTAFIIGMNLTFFAAVTMFISDPATTIVWSFLAFNGFAMRLKSYLLYVNDFDPPKQKKKASQSISEMLMGVWMDLTGQFVPQPV